MDEYDFSKYDLEFNDEIDEYTVQLYLFRTKSCNIINIQKTYNKISKEFHKTEYLYS